MDSFYYNLLNNGYSKVDDEDLKRYIKSFIYADDKNKIDISISDIILERRHK